jgi:hypothetical protein
MLKINYSEIAVVILLTASFNAGSTSWFPEIMFRRASSIALQTGAISGTLGIGTPPAAAFWKDETISSGIGPPLSEIISETSSLAGSLGSAM